MTVHARSREALREVKNVRMLGHNFSHELIFCVTVPTAFSSHNRKHRRSKQTQKRKQLKKMNVLKWWQAWGTWLVTRMALMTRAKLTIYETFFARRLTKSRIDKLFYRRVFVARTKWWSKHEELLSYLLSPPIIL